MSDAEPDCEYFRRKLFELQEQLTDLEEAGTAAAQTVELDQSRVGRLSRMDAMQAQAMSQAANNRRSATLSAIKAALQRIERGDYGECRKCGVYIARKRLEFDPTVRLCIECAAKREI